MIRLLTLAASLAFTAPVSADQPWQVDPDFTSKKARKDISGAACGPDRCFAVNDETHYIQEFKLTKHRVKPGDRLDLLDEKEEIDAEAIAFSDGVFFITGSHGLSRKKAKFHPAPFTVFRLEGDEIQSSTRLREAIRRTESLGEFAEKPLNRNGANIEGLAAQGDRLFFGFRGPSVKHDAFILETPATALFSDDPLDPTLHLVALGDRIGIRDMAAVEDGILLLTGPVNTLPRRYTVVFWQPETDTLTTLGKVPPADQGKPEGLLVLRETAESYRMLVFHDGAKNGAPIQLVLEKP